MRDKATIELERALRATKELKSKEKFFKRKTVWGEVLVNKEDKPVLKPTPEPEGSPIIPIFSDPDPKGDPVKVPEAIERAVEILQIACEQITEKGTRKVPLSKNEFLRKASEGGITTEGISKKILRRMEKEGLVLVESTPLVNKDAETKIANAETTKPKVSSGISTNVSLIIPTAKFRKLVRQKILKKGS